MPKNKGKGGKNRRRGKNENDNEKRELTFKEDGQEYAQVVKMLGYAFSPSLHFPTLTVPIFYPILSLVLHRSDNTTRMDGWLEARQNKLADA